MIDHHKHQKEMIHHNSVTETASTPDCKLHTGGLINCCTCWRWQQPQDTSASRIPAVNAHCSAREVHSELNKEVKITFF